MNFKKIKLYAFKENLKKITLNQYEHSVCKLCFELFCGDKPIDLTTFNEIRFYALKPDGTVIGKTCAIEKNQVILPIPLQLTTIPGLVKCTVECSEAGGNIRFGGFNIEVIPSQDSEKAIESSDELTLLETTIAEAEKIISAGVLTDEHLTKTVEKYFKKNLNTMDKVVSACCDTEVITSSNYNLFKISEVEFSTRLQDDIEGTTSSNTANAVTGWIPVEYGKYYCMSVLHEGSRTTRPTGAGSMWVRINARKSDGTILVYNKGSIPFASDIEYSKQVINIEYEDIVAIRMHFQINSQDISTSDLLKAYEPMLVQGDTPEQAYQNAMNFEYIDGDEEPSTDVEYTLKHDETKADKTETKELRERLSGSMDIPRDGYIIGTMYALSLAISTGTIANTGHSHGIVTDYIPCTAGNTITVDSDKYTFQVMEYQEKDVPKVYSGVLDYGTTYTVTQNGYVRICIRYVDTTLTADNYLFNHIVANLTGYYDFSEFEQRTYKPSSSPYYRNVNFGVIPYSYYQGVGTDYEREAFGRNTTYATFIEAWKALVANYSTYVTETALGTASDGQMIYLYDFKPVRISNQTKPIPKIIIIAGQHGTEKCNVFGWYYFVRDLLNNWSKHPALDYLRNHVELMIIPVVNTYGFDNLTYKNANEVNINRNYDSNWTLLEDTTSSQYGGAEPFDQPESQIVRDLILSNEDALLVIDSHTCSSESAVSYDIMTYCGVCASTDNYYNRMLDVASHHLSAISANFNVDYELNQPDTIMGFMNTNQGSGILRSWATDNGFVGVLTEGFTGFPNRTAYAGEVYKANEEFVVNYLITAMNYLSR